MPTADHPTRESESGGFGDGPDARCFPTGSTAQGGKSQGDNELALLPPYAPDPNPVEYLWARPKRHALANFRAADSAELKAVARAKLKSAQQRASIINSCWAQAGMR